MQWCATMNITDVLITINSRNVCRSRTLACAHWHRRASRSGNVNVAAPVAHIVEMVNTSSSEPYRNECDHDPLPSRVDVLGNHMRRRRVEALSRREP
jgi:hypothetical protein